MKKMIGWLAAVGMMATMGTTVVACHFGDPIRDPKDLSMFSTKDFEPTVIKWIESENPNVGEAIINDARAVIINYLKDNNIELKSGDLTVWVKIDGEDVAITQNYNFDDTKKYSIEITGIVPNYITIVTNSVNVHFKNFGLTKWNINDFISAINMKEFGNYKSLLGDASKAKKDGFDKMIVKLFADIFAAEPYLVSSAVRGKDYEFELFDEKDVPLGNKVINFNETPIKLRLNLIDQGSKVWGNNNSLYANFKVKEDGKIYFGND